MCVQKPKNCRSIDSLGLCTACTNSQYRIINGLCVYHKSCEKGQYLGDTGQCISLPPGCNDANPTTGVCLTCSNGEPAINGVCCPAGQVVLNGRCLSPDTYKSIIESAQASSVPTCIAYHPTMFYCMGCNGNFEVDPITNECR